MFKIGDVVVCIDQVVGDYASLLEGEEYTVTGISTEMGTICVGGDWWYADRFKLKEKQMENEEIKWEVGQEVWCTLNGKGVVKDTGYDTTCPIYVVFAKTWDCYTKDGVRHSNAQCRTLFFSDPIITADKFPPKKPFIPVLKKGDVVVAVYKEDSTKIEKFVVVNETEEHIEFGEFSEAYIKSCWDFYKLGEEVKFS